jgi:hypothetical protein
MVKELNLRGPRHQGRSHEGDEIKQDAQAAFKHG